MNIDTLFVGDTTTALSDAALAYDKSAISIINTPLTNDVVTAYISLGDHNIHEFVRYLKTAKNLVYVHISSADLKTRTLFWLTYMAHFKPVRNLPKLETASVEKVVDSRKTILPQLWAVGCSFTSSLGVSNNERWAELLGEKLKLKTSILAEPGTSIRWAAGQILRADIKGGDTVVWGLTGVARFPFYTSKETESVTCQNFKSSVASTVVSEKVFLTEHLAYSALFDIQAVIHYAKSLNFNLVITQFPLNTDVNESIILTYLSTVPNFIHCYTDITDKFVDYGFDNAHPGPMQHKQYADILYNFITQGKYADLP